MKILNINNYYHARGGAESHYLALGRLLSECGHNVTWFSSRPLTKEKVDSAYFTDPVNIHKPSLKDIARFLYSKQAFRTVQDIITQNKPDIAHLHIYYGQLTSSILAPLKKAGIPMIQTLHDFKLICPAIYLVSHEAICEDCKGRLFWRAAVNKCNRGSFLRSALSALETYISRVNGSMALIDHFIAPSDFLRNKMIQYGVDAKKISTLRNFIQLDDYQPSGKPGEHFVYLGRLEKLKGIYVFLEAAVKLPDKLFLIVGSGECEKEIAERIRKQDLRNVKLLGLMNKAEIREVVSGAICVIVPSLLYENCPMAILETFAIGRPVVGSAFGGIPELIDHGKDGFLFQPGNVSELVERLSWLSEHPEEVINMGASGRKKAEEKFTPIAFYPKLMDIYRKITMGKS
jgi:glycosyltransferase involved in cell wall biosynthesis